MQKEQEKNYQEITTKMAEYVPIVSALAQNIDTITGMIGSTGSGKSTLISYMQKALMTFEKKKGEKYFINHGDKSGKYPTIGHEMESCTSVPAIYTANGMSFVDLTGWFQTRTANQEIINAYNNSAIFIKGKKVKIVIVAEISSIITMRGGIFVEIVHRLSQFFQTDLTLIINSIILVLSKADTDDWDTPTAMIQIGKIAAVNQNLNHATKTLMQTLVRNKRVYLFPTPDKITNHVEVIRSQLNTLTPAVLTKGGQITLSHKVYNILTTYINKLNGQISEMSKKIALQIKTKFANCKFTNGAEVNVELSKLRKAETILKTQFGKSADERNQIKILEDLKTNLSVSVQSSKQMTKTFTMVAFYTKLNGKINIQSSFIEKISYQIAQNIGKLQILRQKYLSEEEIKKMEIKHNEEMKLRQKEHEELKKKAEQKMTAITKKHDQMIEEQKIKYEKMMKESDQKYKESINNMKNQLQTLRNRQPQVIHIHHESPCQIM